ncbi:MAG: hypothetical protein KC635_09710, partial [Myxococcales bacterium]|nr:hypothetical protein [Myxococcales bacterium]
HSVAPFGPLCGEASCVLRDRVTRVAIPEDMRHTARTNLVMARDGGSLVSFGEHGFHRLSLRTGEREELLDAAAIAAIVPASAAPFQGVVAVGLVPVDDDLVFLSVNVPTGWSAERASPTQDDFRVYAVRDGAATLVLDLQKARCDSGLGPCAGAWPEHATPDDAGDLTAGDWTRANDLLGGQWTRMFDWLPALGRLVVEVPGTWDRWLVAVSPDASEAPIVLSRGRRLLPASRTELLPSWQVDTGHGDLLFAVDYLVSDDEGDLHPARLFGLQSPWLFEHALVAMEGFGRDFGIFWDGILLTTDETNAPWEDVRYEGGPEPGDVLVVGQPGLIRGDGLEVGMLYRSGPRGGVAPLLDDAERALAGVSGVDIGEDGRLCYTRPDHAEVGWLESSGAAPYWPGSALAVWEVPRPVDCR